MQAAAVRRWARHPAHVFEKPSTGRAGGRGAYAALDAVGGATMQLVTSGVRPGGTVLIYGALSGPTLTLNTFDILRKRLEVPCSSAFGVIRVLGVEWDPQIHVPRSTTPALASVPARLACMRSHSVLGSA